MTPHKLVFLLVAASFLSAAIASPQSDVSKKDETSNTIPVGGEAKNSSPTTSAAPTSTSTSTTARPEVKVPTRPSSPAASGFSRFISDIFQIPISVLRAVNNLLTNPFNRDSASATASKSGQ